MKRAVSFFVIILLITIAVRNSAMFSNTHAHGHYRISRAPPRNSNIILIQSDSDFLSYVALYNWTGNGSEENPFIIEDLIIDGQGFIYGIRIHDTQHNFVISDCTVFNTSSGIDIRRSKGEILNCVIINCTTGINIEDISDFKLLNNSIKWNGYGIRVEYCSMTNISYNEISMNTNGLQYGGGYWSIIEKNEIINNTGTGIKIINCIEGQVKDNTVEDNDFGIFLDDADRIRVMNNSMRNQDDHHIRLDSCRRAVIENNTMTGYGDGISITNSNSYTRVLNNTFDNCFEYGIYIGSTGNVFFFNNKLLNCSFYIEPYLPILRDIVIATNNTVNGKSVYLDVDKSLVNIPSDAGQIILGGIIEANIEGCNLSKGTVGMILVNCLDVRINNSQIKDNVYYGIFSRDTVSIDIENSEMNGNLKGMDLGVTHLLIDNCSFGENEIGAHFTGVYSADIKDSSFTSNNIGIQVDPAGNDHVRYSIRSNDFIDNLEMAIYAMSDNVSIEGNQFEGNRLGVLFEEFEDDEIHGVIRRNEFISDQTSVEVGSGSIEIDENQFRSCIIGIQFSSPDARSSLAWNNHFEDMARYGIFVFDSEGIGIINNTFETPWIYGIEVYGSEEIVMSYNELYNSSIHLSGDRTSDFSTHEIHPTNTVNSRPVYYISNADSLPNINKNPGQVILANCQDLSLRDLTFDGGFHSFFIAICFDLAIDNCFFTNVNHSIEIFDSTRIKINDTRIINTEIGVSSISCTSMEIEDCSIRNISENGIYLRQTGYADIVQTEVGEGEGNGITLQDCYDLDISRCVIRDMNDGIRLIGSTALSEIFHNLITNNSGFGAVSEKSTGYNRFFRNCFMHNNGTLHNVGNDPQVDSRSYNSEFEMNHWNTWVNVSEDADGDGILDDPYWVGPGINDFDDLPLVHPPGEILPEPVPLIARIMYLSSEEPLALFFELGEGLEFAPIMKAVITVATGGEEETVIIPYNGSGLYRYDHRMSEGTDGVHYDLHTESMAGSSMSVPYDFPEDPTPPSVNILFPLNGSLLNQNMVRINWEAFSNVGGELVDLKVIVNGEEETFSDTDLNHTSKRMTEGLNTVSVRVMNHFGNTAEDSVEFIVDTTAPSFFFEEMGPVKSPVRIQWDFDYHENETLRMWWSQPGTELAEIDPLNRSIVLALNHGSQAVDFLTRDLAGNEYRSRIVLDVDNNPPSVEDWGPKETEWQTNDKIWLLFSEPMDPASIEILAVGLNFTLEFVNDSHIQMIPLMVMDQGKRFDITVMGTDLAGNAMEPYEFVFSTSSGIEDMTMGDLKIIIVDNEGNPIQGSSVTIYPQNTIFSDEHGNGIEIENLEPGEYEIKVEADGYETKKLSIIITPGTTHSEVVVLDEKDEEGSISQMLYLIPLFALLAIVFLVVFLMNRRGDESPEE